MLGPFQNELPCFRHSEPHDQNRGQRDGGDADVSHRAAKILDHETEERGAERRADARERPDEPLGQVTTEKDDFTGRMFEAINGMLLDMLAAIARKDYEDRRRRQFQGQQRAKAEGKYRGRQENVRRNKRIAALLTNGSSYSDVQDAVGCSRATVAKIAKRVRVSAPEMPAST